MSDACRQLLGGLSPAAFLARHWQKEARRIPAALPGFAGPLDLPALKRLAARDDIESRLVVRERTTWTLRRGPLRAPDFRDDGTCQLSVEGQVRYALIPSEYLQAGFRPAFVMPYSTENALVISGTDSDFLGGVANTIQFTVISVVLELALGLFVAMVVNSKFKGRGFMRAVMLVPWAIPTVISAGFGN